MIVKTSAKFKPFLYLTAVLCTVFAVNTAIFATDGDDQNTAEPITILALGDSLTAGYGLGSGDGFVGQLQAFLNDRMDTPVKVINAGVSGDTTTGGRSRLEWSLSPIKNGRPDLVILEFGGNDGLRGIDPKITADNMDAMVGLLRGRGINVLVAGMLAPPNLGAEYAGVFDAAFKNAADKHRAHFYPFFLDGVAGDPHLNQADGIHPTKEGIAVIVSKIGPIVQSVLP